MFDQEVFFKKLASYLQDPTHEAIYANIAYPSDIRIFYVTDEDWDGVVHVGDNYFVKIFETPEYSADNFELEEDKEGLILYHPKYGEIEEEFDSEELLQEALHNGSYDQYYEGDKDLYDVEDDEPLDPEDFGFKRMSVSEEINQSFKDDFLNTAEQNYHENRRFLDTAVSDISPGSCVREYAFKPPPEFLRVGSEPEVYYGIEVEYELKKPSLRGEVCRVFEGHSEFYLKEDSSLSHGLEIVSHPFTPRWLVENFNKVKQLFSSLRNLVYDTSSTGLHVHVSRAGLSSDTVFMLQRIVYTEQEWIVALSGRQPTRYWSFEQRGNRYTALNVTDHTYEFRSMRSSSDWETLYFRILTFMLMVEYSEYLGQHIKKNFPDAGFYKFVQEYSSFASLRKVPFWKQYIYWLFDIRAGLMDDMKASVTRKEISTLNDLEKGRAFRSSSSAFRFDTIYHGGLIGLLNKGLVEEFPDSDNPYRLTPKGRYVLELFRQEQEQEYTYA